ncbi:MAG: hypothetical protein AAFX87_07055 [Bacteroidota bacterium]
MKRLALFIAVILGGVLTSCSSTIHTTQKGQTWSEYRSYKNQNSMMVDKTKRPKTKRKKQNW